MTTIDVFKTDVIFEVGVTSKDSFCIEDSNLSPKTIEKIHQIVRLTQFSNDPNYEVVKNACPFLQGYNIGSGWIQVEFWTMDGDAIQLFIDFVNEEISKL